MPRKNPKPSRLTFQRVGVSNFSMEVGKGGPGRATRAEALTAMRQRADSATLRWNPSLDALGPIARQASPSRTGPGKGSRFSSLRQQEEREWEGGPPKRSRKAGWRHSEIASQTSESRPAPKAPPLRVATPWRSPPSGDRT